MSEHKSRHQESDGTDAPQKSHPRDGAVLFESASDATGDATVEMAGMADAARLSASGVAFDGEADRVTVQIFGSEFQAEVALSPDEADANELAAIAAAVEEADPEVNDGA